MNKLFKKSLLLIMLLGVGKPCTVSAGIFGNVSENPMPRTKVIAYGLAVMAGMGIAQAIYQEYQKRKCFRRATPEQLARYTLRSWPFMELEVEYHVLTSLAERIPFPPIYHHEVGSILDVSATKSTRKNCLHRATQPRGKL